MAAPKVKPKDISFSDIVVDITCHPKKDVIACGTIEGDVFLHSYSPTSGNSELMTFNDHKKSCRVLRFSENGEELYTGSKDKSINTIDLNTGSLKATFTKAHKSPIYSMLVTGENFIVTGDDDGFIKLWDLRQQVSVMELRESEEFISDLGVDSKRRTLLATSGDGTLTVINLRRKKLEMQSELFDSEFLSLALLKKESKVVCGCGMGELNIFNWGEWGNISDRFPGHPMSVDCMLSFTDDIILTGSCDGMIRAVNVLPNRFLGVIGEHPGDLPVENISLSHDKRYLASCSHDQKIKFWNVETVGMETVDTKSKAKRGNKNKFLQSSANNDFFSGLDDPAASSSNTGNGDDDDDDDDDNDDEEEEDDDDEDDDES